MTIDATSSVCNLGVLESLTADDINEIMESWKGFCLATEALLNGNAAHLSFGSNLASHAHTLSNHGLDSLVQQHFFCSLEENFEKNGASKFWQHFDAYSDVAALEMSMDPILTQIHDPNMALGHQNRLVKILKDRVQQELCKALEEISFEKQYQEKCLLMLIRALQPNKDIALDKRQSPDAERLYLLSRYQLIVSSVLMATLPRHFPEILHWYFKGRLEELSTIMAEDCEDDSESQGNDDMDLDEKNKLPYRTGDMAVDEFYHRKLANSKLVKNIGMVVRDLRSLGFTSMTEDAYASAILLLLKAKVHNLAGDDYRSSVLESIKGWIQAVPLQFLHALLAYLGESISYDSPSSDLKSPLASHPSSCYAGVDNPSEGLIRWQLRLEYFAYETLQDLRTAKLFEIIVDYPDSSPAIEDLKQCLEYTGQHSKLVDSFISALRYRLLTAGASTNDILHQYVSTVKALRTIDPAGVFLEAVSEPIREYLKGRKDTVKCIVTMLTDGTGGNSNGPGNTGDSLLEELNRDEESQENTGVDDDINTDIKQAWINAERWEPDPVEADPLKGSRNRRKVDILGMVVSIIGSKDQLVNEYRVMLAEKLLNKSDYDIDAEIRTLELLKDEALNLPEPVDQLLSDYAKRFNEIKTPRKLLWKKNLGTVKLELEFEDRSLQFTVTPVHASIIMHFQDQTRWTSKNLAAAIGLPVDVLNRRINFWISKGIISESLGADSNDHIFALVDGTIDTSRSGANSGGCEELLVVDEDGERSVASVEDQLRKEMTVYEKFITGMLTNFGSMALDRIHNTLKMFCVADPPYDKSLQQLQTFLSGLIAEEKLELRGGMYFLKK
ncbi:hypothetical protein TEA_023680 [Camellia sinensis var. sinensis]|uniref:Anaphase-promoting complex subunit 2 n=1 Tax=Camellia sinensis var. sinensis TaxID=542762 RepID=A0A4V3WPS8_CAMSN|nr:hypothetical protein TEA_023680 [Camellia sinensis var. sinensis]